MMPQDLLLEQLTGTLRVGIALETLLDALPGAIVVVDDEGRISFADNAVAELSGHAAEDLVGRPVEVLVPPGQHAVHEQDRRRYADAPRSRSMGAPLDIMLRHRDGHDIPVDISLSPVEVQQRRYVVAAIRDDSERREAMRATQRALEREREASAKLREADETKNAFIRAVSHELRTPLTVVQGMASTLDERLLEMPEEQVAQVASSLARAARRLNTLLTDLLDVDRLTRGVVEANRRTVDVAELARRTLERSVPAQTPVRLEGPDHLDAEVDAAQVERMLENLIVNAVRHTAPGTPVTVSWQRHGPSGGVLLGVDDEGPGIDPQLRERIFAPFVQGDTRRHDPGTGIGLSLVAQFARLHDGEVWVQERPGGGSAFRVLLPPPAEDGDGEEATTVVLP
jgi:two-component system, LuxR family, sensor kinase FixL